MEDIDPDWTISFNIEESGTMVTSTASHRSVSLNERYGALVSHPRRASSDIPSCSWAGEVFVLIVKIERDTSSANLNNQRPSKGATVSAQLTWAVRLVVDSASSGPNEKTSPDNDFVPPQDASFTSPVPLTQGITITSSDTFEAYQSGKHAGETVSTHVNVQPDRVDTLAVIGDVSRFSKYGTSS